jgi:hypothetical protein
VRSQWRVLSIPRRPKGDGVAHGRILSGRYRSPPNAEGADRLRGHRPAQRSPRFPRAAAGARGRRHPLPPHRHRPGGPRTLRQRGGNAALHRARHARRPRPEHRHGGARHGGAGRLPRGRRHRRDRRTGNADSRRLRRAPRFPDRLRRHRAPGRRPAGAGDRGAAPGAGAGRRRPRLGLGRTGADAPGRAGSVPHHRFPGDGHRAAVPRVPPDAAKLPRGLGRRAHLHPRRGGGGAAGRRAGAGRQPVQRGGGGRAAGAESGRAAPPRRVRPAQAARRGGGLGPRRGAAARPLLRPPLRPRAEQPAAASPLRRRRQLAARVEPPGRGRRVRPPPGRRGARHRWSAAARRPIWNPARACYRAALLTRTGP